MDKSLEVLANLLETLDRKNDMIYNLHTALEAATEGLSILDLDKNFKRTNPVFANMLGYEQGELDGRSCEEIFSSEDIENCKLLIAGLTPETNIKTNIKGIKKDKSIINLRCFIQYALNQKSEIIGYHFFIQDITEKIQMIHKIEQEKERMRLVLEATTPGFWDWDLNTGKVFYSRAMQALLGLTDEDNENYTYNTWADAIHREDIEKCEKAVNDHLNGITKRYCVAYRIYRKDIKSYLYMVAKGKAFKDDDGKNSRMIGTIEWGGLADENVEDYLVYEDKLLINV